MKMINEPENTDSILSAGDKFKKCVSFDKYDCTVTAYVKKKDNKYSSNKYQVFHFAEYSHSDDTYDSLYASYKTLEDANMQIAHERELINDEDAQSPMIVFNGKRANGLAESTADIEVKKRNHQKSKYNDYLWEKEKDYENRGKFVVIGRLKKAYNKET